ncbi:MAG: hypothetical protein AAGI15_13910 [Pseudomonadota bacterium]
MPTPAPTARLRLLAALLVLTAPSPNATAATPTMEAAAAADETEIVDDETSATSYADTGTVTEVIPIVRRERVIEPVETCRLERVRNRGERRIVHPITLRDGQLRINPPHRVLGALFGNRRPAAVRDEPVQEVCREVERARYVDEITGYRVRYRYGGERFTRITKEHPGTEIPLQIRIEPRI